MDETRNVMRIKRAPEEMERDFDMLRKWFSLKGDKFEDKKDEEFVLLYRARMNLDRFNLPGEDEKAVRRAMEDAKRLPLGLHRPEWTDLLHGVDAHEAYAKAGKLEFQRGRAAELSAAKMFKHDPGKKRKEFDI